MRPGVSGRSRRSYPALAAPDFGAPAEYTGRPWAPAARGAPRQPLSRSPPVEDRAPVPSIDLGRPPPPPWGVAPAPLPEGQLARDARAVPSTFWRGDPERLAYPPGE